MNQNTSLNMIPSEIINIILNYTSLDDRVYIKEVSLRYYREFSISQDKIQEAFNINNDIYTKYITYLEVLNNTRCLNVPNLYKFTRDCIINDYKSYYDKYGMQLCIAVFNSLYVIRRFQEDEYHKDEAAYITADFLKYN